MKYLALLALLVGCPQSGAEESKYHKPFAMECNYVTAEMLRCENQEVVCYRGYMRGYSESLQCKFKETK